MKNRQLGLRVLAVFLMASLSACDQALEDTSSVNVTLPALDIKWDTSNIDASVGQTITITIANEGMLDHNLVIQDLSVDVDIAAGNTEEVTFMVSEAGTMVFMCNVPGHFEAGMAGTITVSE